MTGTRTSRRGPPPPEVRVGTPFAVAVRDLALPVLSRGGDTTPVLAFTPTFGELELAVGP
jgi:hypothetical protein